jgi:hypothetical protein
LWTVISVAQGQSYCSTIRDAGKDSIKYSFHISIWRLSGVRLDHAITLTEFFLQIVTRPVPNELRCDDKRRVGNLSERNALFSRRDQQPTSRRQVRRHRGGRGQVALCIHDEHGSSSCLVESWRLRRSRNGDDCKKCSACWKLKTSRRTRSRRLSSWTE